MEFLRSISLSLVMHSSGNDRITNLIMSTGRVWLSIPIAAIYIEAHHINYHAHINLRVCITVTAPIQT
jgi:hypothetical protein